MIVIEKKEIKTCCGKKQFFLKIKNASILKEHLDAFNKAGFTTLKSFYDAGIMYIEDAGLAASCPFGLNEIQIKCKNDKDKCAQSLINLEKIILTSL